MCRLPLVLCSLLVVGCGKKVEEADSQKLGRLGELRAKYQENVEKAKKEWDQETGWPSKDDCDGTLWAGLARAGQVSSVMLNRAKHADGKIHRRPTSPCYANGQDLGSKSTISKDMLLGYVYGLFRSGNRGELEYLFGYGRSNNWIMGEPASEVGRVVLTPNGIATLCRAIKSLGGSYKPECDLPVSFGSGNADFERHLAVLGILLWGEVNGGTKLVESSDAIPAGALETLTRLSYESPKDALFQAAYALYTTGDYSYPVDLLLGEYSYPSYVRGSEHFRLVHWIFTADLILRRF